MENNSKSNNSNVMIEVDSEVNEIFMKTKVTQEFINNEKEPIEIKIYIPKSSKLIFSSFQSKIGNSMIIKSKIIKKEKAEEKYSDIISSGNAAILVLKDSLNSILVNIGNIPPNEKVIFISEFIQKTEYSLKYGCELFKYLPIFQGKCCDYPNKVLNGRLIIKTQKEIINIKTEILLENLKIIEQKYLNKDKNIYQIIYQIENLEKLFFLNHDFIPCSKIFFEVNNNEPIVYTQKLSNDSCDKIYKMQYINKMISENKGEILPLNPALFIFLIDQSYSMDLALIL